MKFFIFKCIMYFQNTPWEYVSKNLKTTGLSMHIFIKASDLLKSQFP